MWKCHKCGKPVYFGKCWRLATSTTNDRDVHLIFTHTHTMLVRLFAPGAAERKQSLGYDWHPECLRCEECGKRLNPGLHAEHKGVPYCHVPCYGALFGPQLFGHGTRVESHRSFGDKQAQQQQQLRAAGGGGPALPRDHIESKLRVYNQYQGCNGSSHEIRSREVNERLVLEGALRICWGVQGMIHLKEDDDQRTVVTVRKRNSCRYNLSGDGRPAAAEQQQPDDDEEEDARNVSETNVYLI